MASESYWHRSELLGPNFARLLCQQQPYSLRLSVSVSFSFSLLPKLKRSVIFIAFIVADIDSNEQQQQPNATQSSILFLLMAAAYLGGSSFCVDRP